MSTQPQRERGRVVRNASRSPMPVFYIILGVVAIGGVIALAVMVTRGRAQLPPASISVTPLTVPSGLTEDGLYYKGQPDAPVTVKEYADFQCPGCAVFATRVEPEITRDYVNTGKVRFVFHDFPLNQHANAVPAAEAARCAGAQNAFWSMHDTLFLNQRQWENSTQAEEVFTGYAEQLKLDRGAFAQCMQSDQFLGVIDQARLASERVPITVTPTLMVNGKIIETENLRAEIEAALAAKQ